jgi:aminopeptidase N
MDSWIFQPGFPVVVPGGGQLAQRRFAYEPARTDEQWSVPVLARIHHNGDVETRSILLEAKPVALDAPDDALVVLNAGGEGFYRVAYSSEWRDRLLDAGVLGDLERFALLDDLWAFTLAGDTHVDEFLSVAMRFEAERELAVWRTLLTRVRLAARVADGEALERLKARTAALIAPAFEQLGWDPKPGEDERTRQLRGVFCDTLGSFVEDPEAIARAREVVDHGSRDADIAAASVAVVAATGTADDYETFVARTADGAGSPQEQLRYLYALGQFPDEELVLRATRYAASEAVRTQNGPFMIGRAMRNRDHGPLVWSYVRDHWDELSNRFNGTLMTRLLDGVTWLIDDASVADVPRFLADHPIPEGTKVIAQHVERQRVHRALRDRDGARLKASLLR